MGPARTKSLLVPVAKLIIPILAFITTNVAGAAIITVESRNDNEPALVFVAGKLEPGDGDQFRSKTSFLSKAVVSFRSDGGSVTAAIQIGEIIRLKGFTTSVAQDARCASACALAWLGGIKRFMSADSKIGFHAAYNPDGRESGVGNAMIGAYLNKIGLSYSALTYITQAAPNSMRWLSARDAEKHGIDVELLGSPQVAVAPAPTTSPEVVTQPPCMAEFVKLREDVQKKGLAAKAAGARKVSREEMCQYITAYYSAYLKWVRFTELKLTSCGIPVNVLQELKQLLDPTDQTRNKICGLNWGRSADMD